MKKVFSSALVYLVAIISILVVQFIGGIALVFLPENQDMIVYAIMIAIQMINILIVFTASRKHEFVSLYKIEKISAKNTVISVVLALITFVSLYLVLLYVFEFLTLLGVKASEIRVDGGYIILAILSTVIFAPIGEEMVYRYVICSALESKSKIFAIIISALCFTLMHMSPMQTVYQFALGCILALIVIKTRNIVYAIIAHATSNLVAIILSLINLPQINIYSPLTIIITVLMLVLGVVLTIILVKKMEGKKTEEKQEQISKNEKTASTIIFIIGFIICLAMWCANFF